MALTWSKRASSAICTFISVFGESVDCLLASFPFSHSHFGSDVLIDSMIAFVQIRVSFVPRREEGARQTL